MTHFKHLKVGKRFTAYGGLYEKIGSNAARKCVTDHVMGSVCSFMPDVVVEEYLNKGNRHDA